MPAEWPITRYAVRYRRPGDDDRKPWIVLGNYDRPGDAYALKISMTEKTAQDPHVVSFQQTEYVRYEDE